MSSGAYETWVSCLSFFGDALRCIEAANSIDDGTLDEKRAEFFHNFFAFEDFGMLNSFFIEEAVEKVKVFHGLLATSKRRETIRTVMTVGADVKLKLLKDAVAIVVSPDAQEVPRCCRIPDKSEETFQRDLNNIENLERVTAEHMPSLMDGATKTKDTQLIRQLQITSLRAKTVGALARGGTLIIEAGRDINMLPEEQSRSVSVFKELATVRTAVEDATSMNKGYDISRWDTCFNVSLRPEPHRATMLDKMILSQYLLVDLLDKITSIIADFRNVIQQEALRIANTAFSCCPSWNLEPSKLFEDNAMLMSLVGNANYTTLCALNDALRPWQVLIKTCRVKNALHLGQTEAQELKTYSAHVAETVCLTFLV